MKSGKEPAVDNTTNGQHKVLRAVMSARSENVLEYKPCTAEVLLRESWCVYELLRATYLRPLLLQIAMLGWVGVEHA